MRKLASLIFALLLLTPLGVSAKTYYVTDKVLVGVYEQPDTDSKLLKVIPTGTPLEILERSDKYARVRTSDGLIGWLDSTYTIDHKPAQHVVLELADKQKQTQQELDAANNQVSALEKEIKQLKIQNRTSSTNDKKISGETAALAENLKKRDTELKAANEQLKILKNELASLHQQIDKQATASGTDKNLQTTIDALNKQLAEKNQTIATLEQRIQNVMQVLSGKPAASMAPARHSFLKSIPAESYIWVLVAAVSALILGFLIAYIVLQRRSLRRHGSFRIHLNS